MIPKGKRPRDPNQLAHMIVAMSTGEAPIEPDWPVKNPAAVSLGRLGGLQGGKARAAKLSAERKLEIATKAAAVRWRKNAG